MVERLLSASKVLESAEHRLLRVPRWSVVVERLQRAVQGGVIAEVKITVSSFI